MTIIKCNKYILTYMNMIFRMTKETLKDICKQSELYIVPKHNNVLYLHFKGRYLLLCKKNEYIFF